MLVEDNPADVRLVRTALEHHGVAGEITVFMDGEKAFGFIQTLDGSPDVPCPDLIIIDLSLPRKSGKEVLESLRSTARCRAVPVAILSSSDAEQDKVHAMRLGASRYIRKPSRLEEFLALGMVFHEMSSGSS